MLEKFVGNLPADVTIEPYDGPAAKPKPKESAAQAVERVRGEVAGLRATRKAIENAPIPSTLAKAMARKQIEELAARGRPDMRPLLDHGQPFRWPEAPLRAELHGFATSPTGALDNAHAQQPDTLALFVWMTAEPLLFAIEAEIDANSRDDAALTAEQRAERLAELDASILATERDEVSLVDAAGADHRGDIDVRAWLAISGTLPAPR